MKRKSLIIILLSLSSITTFASNCSNRTIYYKFHCGLFKCSTQQRNDQPPTCTACCIITNKCGCGCYGVTKHTIAPTIQAVILNSIDPNPSLITIRHLQPITTALASITQAELIQPPARFTSIPESER